MDQPEISGSSELSIVPQMGSIPSGQRRSRLDQQAAFSAGSRRYRYNLVSLPQLFPFTGARHFGVPWGMGMLKDTNPASQAAYRKVKQQANEWALLPSVGLFVACLAILNCLGQAAADSRVAYAVWSPYLS